jgi:release factor glutamine methyltransferase
MKYYYKNIDLEVPNTVYYPSEDSELLAEFLEKNKKQIQFKKVLEIGCGSGFISILCAKLGASVTAVDVNAAAIDITLSNAKQNHVYIQAFSSDLFACIKEKFDVIIFNAPYLPENSEDIITKKHTAAFSSQYSKKDVIKRFISQYKNFLLSKGRVFIVVSSVTGEKLEGRIVARRKIDWEELRVVELR